MRLVRKIIIVPVIVLMVWQISVLSLVLNR
jgi:hypothetical protein